MRAVGVGDDRRPCGSGRPGATGIGWHPRVDAAAHAGGEDGRELLGEVRAHGFARIEEGAAAGGALGVDGAGDHVARRQLGVRMVAGHEPLAVGVDQHGAFAAQRLGGQRRGVAADVDGRGVELHEFGVGDQRAGQRRQPRPSPRSSAGVVVTA